jgi:hypothetical protein
MARPAAGPAVAAGRLVIGRPGGGPCWTGPRGGRSGAGARAGPIARQLREHGYRILAQEGFIIDGSAHGPLLAGETDRAAA